jgi:hypothetical protein
MLRGSKRHSMKKEAPLKFLGATQRPSVASRRESTQDRQEATGIIRATQMVEGEGGTFLSR